MTKVVVIEDDQVLRDNLKEILELEGFDVMTAEDGKKGVEICNTILPDIILCDIVMPGINGFDILTILKEVNTTQNIPFVFISAKAEKACIRKGMNMGADDYLTKPIEEKDLVAAVKSQLEKFRYRKVLPPQNISPIPEGLTELADLKKVIVDKGKYICFKKNQNIYTEGEKSNYTYVLNKGVIKTHKMDAGGKRIILNIFNENDLFGYLVFSSSVYEETATAIQDGSAFRIPKRELKEILLHNPMACFDLAALLSNELSQLKDHLLNTAYSGVLQKSTHAIIHLAQKLQKTSGEPITFSRSDVASMAGISTESFIRCLSTLKKDNLIYTEGRKIKILNLKKLQVIK